MSGAPLPGRSSRGTVLSLLLVAGVVLGGAVALAAVASSPVAAHGTAGDHADSHDDQTVANESGLVATGFAIEDRTLGPDEPLHATMTFDREVEGPAAAPITMSVDGERHRLGTLSVSNGNATFDGDGSGPDSWTVVIECTFEDTNDNYLPELQDCEIYIDWDEPFFGTVGDHEVGFNGLEPVGVRVVDDSPHNASLSMEGYQFDDTEVDEGAPLTARIDIGYEGEGPASTVLTMTVDGERRDLGTLHYEAGRIGFDEYIPTPIDEIEIHCEDEDEDGWIEIPWECEIILSHLTGDLPAGDHEIGFNDLDPVDVTVGERPADLRAASYEISDRTLAPGESTNATVVYEMEGEGSASAPIAMTVDGERHRLGTVSVENGTASVVPIDEASLAYIPVFECYWVDVDGDGVDEYICVILDPGPLTASALSPGEHTVSFNGLEPTRITVEESSSGVIRDPWPCSPDPPWPFPGSPGPTNPFPCLPFEFHLGGGGFDILPV